MTTSRALKKVLGVYFGVSLEEEGSLGKKFLVLKGLMEKKNLTLLQDTAF